MNREGEISKVGRAILDRLLAKGVRIPSPASVVIGPDVQPDRVSGNGVVIHGGCRIQGSKVLIMDRVELGKEAPVTIDNCQLGREVQLKGGFFGESTFLEKASVGSGAQIREGSLLEEEANSAHTVGLKQTILFPFVTLGSLINFCDCLMAGGTDRKNHSEVGSSYIHFNFTPNQDKATPSLIGDVPKGVMLDQPPIFLGGQGGLVGPVEVAYGTVVVAGTIVRKDLRRENTVLFGHPSTTKSMPFHRGLYTNLKRIVNLNTNYISNIIALRRWYLEVRSRFLGGEQMDPALHEGALEKLDLAIEERLKRLGEVALKMPRSIEIYREINEGRVSEKTIERKQEFCDRWPDLEGAFRECLGWGGDTPKRESFQEAVEKSIGRNGKDYISVIKGLDEEESKRGTSWLQGLVDEINNQVWGLLPGLEIVKPKRA